MALERRYVETTNLDERLLWSPSQSSMDKLFQRLVDKCKQQLEGRSLVFVVDQQMSTHSIAVFNLAMAHSFHDRTILIDATTNYSLGSQLLNLSPSELAQPSQLAETFTIGFTSSSALFNSAWPRHFEGYTGSSMFAVVNASEAFRLDWNALGDEIAVLALAAPNDLEEERWQRLKILVGAERFAGLWIVE